MQLLNHGGLLPPHEELILAPGARTLVPTGWALELPQGFEGQVRPRSGFALQDGVTVLNSPGTIDADYRGEVGVILINLGQSAVALKRGLRIAQLVVSPVIKCSIEMVYHLGGTNRGERGFGSTGL